MIEEERKQIEQDKAVAEKEKMRMGLVHAYKRMSATDDGKLILKDLEMFCGQYNSCMNEQAPDAYQTFVMLGKRRVFLRIHGMINQKEKEDG